MRGRIRKVCLNQIDILSGSVEIGPQIVGLNGSILDRLALLAPPVVQPNEGRYRCVGNARIVYLYRATIGDNDKRDIQALVLESDDWDDAAWRCLDEAATLLAGNSKLSKRSTRDLTRLLKSLPGTNDPDSISALATGYPDEKS